MRVGQRTGQQVSTGTVRFVVFNILREQGVFGCVREIVCARVVTEY